MKTLKWLLIGLATLVLLAFIGVGILLLAVDRGEYKQEIVEQVEKHTGRSLTINGDLDISLFPWIGISIGELSMSNAPGFADDPFVEARAVNVKVEVLPLLRRELRVDRVEVVDVALDLQRNDQGVNNWDDLTQSSESTGTIAGTTGTPAETQNSPLAALAIGGVDVSNARIRWRDASNGTDLVLRDFNLMIGEITLHDSFPVQMSFNLKNRVTDQRADLTLQSQASIDIQNQRYQLVVERFTAEIKDKKAFTRTISAQFSTDILADLLAQTVSLRRLEGQIINAPLRGEFTVSQVATDPKV
ncbi:MAG: AsmA family protein, partial [Pseudomonadota bacterium]